MRAFLTIFVVLLAATQMGCRGKERDAHIHDVLTLRFMAFHAKADKVDQIMEELDVVIGLKDWSMRGLGEANKDGKISIIAHEGEETLCLFALEEDLTPEERVAIKAILNKHGATGPFFAEGPEDRD